MSSTGKSITAFYLASDGTLVLANLRKDLPVSALSVSGTTATLTSEAHGLSTGDKVNVSGCVQDYLNGDWTVASATTDDFTFAIADADTQDPDVTATPNRGLILCAVYLDDATVTATCVAISGLGTLTFDYKTGSNGLYVARLPDTAAMVDGTTYTFIITATAQSGEVLTTLMTGPAKYAGV
jgi:hypothetical protein